jgi:hypothetical protein
MRSRSFIPLQAKSVGHEARNGMVLCMNHRYAFDAYFFYIRWMPEVCSSFIPISSTLQRFLVGQALRSH